MLKYRQLATITAISLGIVACSKPTPRRALGDNPTPPAPVQDSNHQEPTPMAADSGPSPVAVIDVPTVNNPVPVDATVFVLPQQTPDAGTDPAVRWRDGLAQLERSIIESSSPIGPLIAAQSPGVRAAAEEFVYCTAMQTPQACTRLDQARRLHCEFSTRLVRGRSTMETGWAQTPELIQMCTQFSSMTEAQCLQYTEAVERGNPARCNGLPAVAADCAAHASGVPSRCRRGAGSDPTCDDDTRNYALLRRGIRPLVEQGSGLIHGAAVGVNDGPSGCTTALHQTFARLSANPPPEVINPPASVRQPTPQPVQPTEPVQPSQP